MYDTSDLKKGLKIMFEGGPFLVIEAQFVKPGKGAAFTRTKMRNLLTGSTIERNIRSGEKMPPADVEENEMTFLYKEGDAFVFMDSRTYDQVQLAENLIGDDWRWLKDNLSCQVLFYNSRPIAISLPNFVELQVTKSEPGVKGDTSGGAMKAATLSTGAEINVPLFINEGDFLRIDTRDGQYIERVKGG